MAFSSVAIYRRPSRRSADLNVILLGVTIVLAATGVTDAMGDDRKSARPGAVPNDSRYDSGDVAAIFGTPTPRVPDDPRVVALGQRLFHDSRLSGDGSISCATCHILSDGGDDNRARSVGVSGKPTRRNSPSVFNLDGQVAYFWDGRAASLADQIDGPVHNPDELATSWPAIVDSLNGDAGMVARFNDIFGGPPTEKRIKDALVAFQLSLTTADLPFDDYLAGNDAALTGRATTGLRIFLELGCASCHQGPLLGGNLFQRLGIFEPYPHGEGADAIFKVPSLRNVALTAPYFHDGSVATLGEAVRLMSRHQLGHDIAPQEETAVIAFLKSLTSGALSAQSFSVGTMDP